MAIYSKLELSDLQAILTQYDLGALVTAKPLAGGQENTSFKIETQHETIILSIIEDKPIESVQNLTVLLDHLANHSFLTTTIVKSKSGDAVILYNQKPVFIKKFIPGQVVKNLNPKQIFQLGKNLGTLHQIPPCNHLPIKHPYGIESFQEIFEADDPHGFIAWLKEETTSIRQRLDHDLPKGLVHGDLSYDNVLYNDNQLAAIIDFEEASHYFLGFDIGMTIVGNCTKEGQLSKELVQVLLEGYQSVRKLHENELEKIQFFMEYAAVTTAFWRYRQYQIRRPEAGNNDSYLLMKSIAEQAKTFLI